MCEAMRPASGMAVAVSFQIVVATAVAHDTGLDGLYSEPSNPAYMCHHMGIQQWDEIIGIARMKIELLRYRHVRPKVDDPRVVEFRWRMMQNIAQIRQTAEERLHLIEARAKELCCRPRANSG